MEHDAPIKYSKRERGYYYEDPDFSINDIPLTEDELGAISFAAKTLMQFRDVGMFQQFSSAIDKIVDRVSVSDDDADEFIQFEKSMSGEGNEFLTPILEAIKQQLVITFDYTSFVSGEMKPRKVLPLLLKEYSNRWYLISFDLSKNTYITYGLDRMEEVEVSKERMSRPADFNADNFFKYAVGITSGNTPPEIVEFKAKTIAAKYIDSLPFHTSQKVIAMNDTGFTFSLEVNVSEELIRLILSYGGDVKVLKPKSLKKEIENRASAILKA
jgi:predicted DNA-binding transcriptional regulator YafY